MELLVHNLMYLCLSFLLGIAFSLQMQACERVVRVHTLREVMSAELKKEALIVERALQAVEFEEYRKIASQVFAMEQSSLVTLVCGIMSKLNPADSMQKAKLEVIAERLGMQAGKFNHASVREFIQFFSQNGHVLAIANLKIIYERLSLFIIRSNDLTVPLDDSLNNFCRKKPFTTRVPLLSPIISQHEERAMLNRQEQEGENVLRERLIGSAASENRGLHSAMPSNKASGQWVLEKIDKALPVLTLVTMFFVFSKGYTD